MGRAFQRSGQRSTALWTDGGEQTSRARADFECECPYLNWKTRVHIDSTARFPPVFQFPRKSEIATFCTAVHSTVLCRFTTFPEFHRCFNSQEKSEIATFYTAVHSTVLCRFTTFPKLKRYRGTRARRVLWHVPSVLLRRSLICHLAFVLDAATSTAPILMSSGKIVYSELFKELFSDSCVF